MFDSVFDIYRGVVSYVRMFSGRVEPGSPIRLLSTGKTYDVKEVGVFTPKMFARGALENGDVGYIIANIKSTAEIKIGDTLTDTRFPTKEPLPGFQEIHPMVFSGIYPINTADFEKLKTALGKLQLNDAAFVFQPESTVALGFGFRCGFLGLLHMEIIQERLRREYDMDIIATYPSVIYEVIKTNGERLEVDNPTHLPDPSVIGEIREPVVKAFLMCPNENIGDMMQLVMDKRGEMLHTETLDDRRVMLTCRLPLNEILVDFNDKIKSITRGYGSMDYEYDGYRAANLVKLDILVNGEPVDAFSSIVHRDKAESRARAAGGQAQGSDPDAALSGVDPGSHRREDRGARERQRDAQGRDRQMLRRRHHPQTQAARKAEGRQKAHEEHRQGEHPAGSVHPGAQGGLGIAPLFILSHGHSRPFSRRATSRKPLCSPSTPASSCTAGGTCERCAIADRRTRNRPPRSRHRGRTTNAPSRKRSDHLDKVFAAAAAAARGRGLAGELRGAARRLRAGHRHPRVFPPALQDSHGLDGADAQRHHRPPAAASVAAAGAARQLFESLWLGRSYVDAVSEVDDQVVNLVREALRILQIHAHRVRQRAELSRACSAGDVDPPDVDVRRLRGRPPANVRYRAGEPIARGYVDTGDQVFVDKFTYNFRLPKRGRCLRVQHHGHHGHPDGRSATSSRSSTSSGWRVCRATSCGSTSRISTSMAISAQEPGFAAGDDGEGRLPRVFEHRGRSVPAHAGRHIRRAAEQLFRAGRQQLQQLRQPRMGRGARRERGGPRPVRLLAVHAALGT